MGFTFALITDAHFHPDDDLSQAGYASDAHFNARNGDVVDALERLAPDFVVHLGDIPHPVPGLPAHLGALAAARRTYGRLTVPLHVVPGNHDVGDKPHPLSPAPRTSAALHQVFTDHWGPAWWSFAHRGCRFIGIDTPVLNSGLPLEEAQWAWLARELAEAAEARIFVFLHYPPFLLRPDEPEHYDNLAEPARSRLLSMLSAHPVVAVFAGHVHHFFHNRHAAFDVICVPSTAFVRPGYAELARIGPVDEHGRNDTGRLGALLVQVDDHGHRLVPVRSHPRVHAPDVAARCPLGFSIRYPWAAVVELPLANFDPFVRKRVHNDQLLWALHDLGRPRVRLPLADLVDTPDRIQVLMAHGFRLVFFVAGLPDAAACAALAGVRDQVDGLELILPAPIAPDALDVLPADLPPLWVSPLGGTSSSAAYFSHFTREAVDGPLPDRAAGRVFLMDDPAGVPEAMAAAAPRTAVCHIRLPRGGEGVAYTDDEGLTAHVLAAWRAAADHPDAVVILDGLVDHDRGYWPRIGLLDRRLDPRPAYDALWARVHRRGSTEIA